MNYITAVRTGHGSSGFDIDDEMKNFIIVRHYLSESEPPYFVRVLCGSFAEKLKPIGHSAFELKRFMKNSNKTKSLPSLRFIVGETVIHVAGDDLNLYGERQEEICERIFS